MEIIKPVKTARAQAMKLGMGQVEDKLEREKDLTVKASEKLVKNTFRSKNKNKRNFRPKSAVVKYSLRQKRI